MAVLADSATIVDVEEEQADIAATGESRLAAAFICLRWENINRQQKTREIHSEP